MERYNELSAAQKAYHQQFENWVGKYKRSNKTRQRAQADEYETNAIAAEADFIQNHQEILTLNSKGEFKNRTYISTGMYDVVTGLIKELKSMIADARQTPDDEDEYRSSDDLSDSDESEDDDKSDDKEKKRRKRRRAEKRKLREANKKLQEQVAENQRQLNRMMEMMLKINTGGSDMNQLANVISKRKIDFPDFRQHEYFEWRGEVEAFQEEDKGASTNNIMFMHLRKACPNKPIVKNAGVNTPFEEVLKAMDGRYLILRNVAGAKIEKLIKFPKSDGTSSTLMKLHDTFKTEFKNLERLVLEHGGHDWDAKEEEDEKARLLERKTLKIQAEIGKIFMSSLPSSKLDDGTRNLILPKIAPSSQDIPDCEKMFEIMNTRFINTASQPTEPKTQKSVSVSFASSTTKRREKRCYFCKKDNHQSYQCRKLLDTPLAERFKFVKAHNVCPNCLNGEKRKCPCDKKAPKSFCKHQGCTRLHNDLLHDDNYKPRPRNEQKTVVNIGAAATVQ